MGGQMLRWRRKRGPTTERATTAPSWITSRWVGGYLCIARACVCVLTGAGCVHVRGRLLPSDVSGVAYMLGGLVLRAQWADVYTKGGGCSCVSGAVPGRWLCCT